MTPRQPLPPFVRLAVLALAVPTFACERAPLEEGFRVALVTPGTITDDGWNAYGHEGLELLRRELGAMTRHVQTRSAAEFEPTLRDFAEQGYDLVIAHGHEYSDAALAVGALYPDAAFVVTSGGAVAPNVSSIDFAMEEPAYLAGMLAGMLSSAKDVGCIGGQEIEPVRDAFAAFERGVRDVAKDAEVRVAWVGSWDDAAAANQAARALLAQGADLLFHDADAAGLGVFNAAEERGVLAIGCNKDQSAVKPTVVVASVVLEIPKAFVALATEVKEGRHVGARRHFAMRDGFVRLAYNDALKHRVSEVMRRRIEVAAEEFLR
jgi:basic membrane protein A